MGKGVAPLLLLTLLRLTTSRWLSVIHAAVNRSPRSCVQPSLTHLHTCITFSNWILSCFSSLPRPLMILTPNCPSKPYYTAPPQISQKTISTHRDLSLSLKKINQPCTVITLSPSNSNHKQLTKSNNNNNQILFKIFTKLFTFKQLFRRNL